MESGFSQLRMYWGHEPQRIEDEHENEDEDEIGRFMERDPPPYISRKQREKVRWRQVVDGQSVRNPVNDNLYCRWQNLFRKFFARIFVTGWKSTSDYWTDVKSENLK